MSVEIEAHTVPNFKAPIYVIMEYEGQSMLVLLGSKTALSIWAV